MNKRPPVISVVGRSNSGKTTVIEKLIPELKSRGYKVGVVKHAAHGFQMDQTGKDSWRYGRSGADTVMIASSREIALIKPVKDPGIADVIPFFKDVDLLITEGYKKERAPKIEVVREEISGDPVCAGDNTLAAFVSDVEVSTEKPVFAHEQSPELADFVEKLFGLREPNR